MTVTDNEKPPVMYMFVNDDLKLSKGQLAAQCSHMAHVITDERLTAMYEEHPPSNDTLVYMRWRKNCVKIIKRATSTQLTELCKLPYARQFVDEAYHIPSGSVTVVGFLPKSPTVVDRDLDVQQYKLL